MQDTARENNTVAVTKLSVLGAQATDTQDIWMRSRNLRRFWSVQNLHRIHSSCDGCNVGLQSI